MDNMTNKISAILLIAFVAYIGVCMWSYGEKTMEASLEQTQ